MLKRNAREGAEEVSELLLAHATVADAGIVGRGEELVPDCAALTPA
jgi:non-ribosomal peptide synthetase component E (peptide arylation enzyme)